MAARMTPIMRAALTRVEDTGMDGLARDQVNGPTLAALRRAGLVEDLPGGRVRALSAHAAEPYRQALAGLAVLADVDFRVRVKPVRSAGLTVGRDGTVTVTAPADTSAQQVARWVAGKAGWLRRHGSGRRRHPVKHLVTDERFPLLGIDHLLRVARTGGPDAAKLAAAGVPIARVGFAGWSDHRLCGIAVDGRHLNAETIIGWYREQAGEWLDRQAGRWLARMGLADRPPTLAVTDLGPHRVGVYRPREHLCQWHWALFQLPYQLVEVSVVHELAHAVDPRDRHGPAWQARMGRALPDWRDRTARLERAIRTVWLGEVTDQAAPPPPMSLLDLAARIYATRGDTA